MVKVPRKWLEFTDHWLKWQSVHVISLLSFPGTSHPNPNATPTSCQVWAWFCQKGIIDHQIYLSTTCTPSSPLSHSIFFSASCSRRTSFLLLEGYPTTWLLTCWGADCAVFSLSFITSILSLFLCTNSRNRGYLRHHLIGTSTGG